MITFMSRLAGFFALACAFIAAAIAQPEQPNGLSKWAFDEITLTNGAKMEGLILSEGADGMRFQSVSRPPGRATVTITWLFTKPEIARTKRLSDSDRAILKERI